MGAFAGDHQAVDALRDGGGDRDGAELLRPGELLRHYGTDEQKRYYLPRLAKGIEIPSRSPIHAGSDAAAIPDYAYVRWGRA
jgi:alkylation response protein AidB-like acyl-CoA dehydrogenase